MSRFEIKMPKLGESITEGTIVSWSVKVGDVIQEDDVLFEVNTAKVSAEIPSPVAGKIVEILFKEGDTVAVGTVVASGKETAESKENTSSDAGKVSSQVAKAEERWYSPVVIQLARGANIPKEELDSIQGTGYEGRLSKKDIKDYIEKKKRGISEVSKAAIPAGAAPAASTTSSPASVSCGCQYSGSRSERNGSCPPDYCGSYGDVQEGFTTRNQCSRGRRNQTGTLA